MKNVTRKFAIGAILAAIGGYLAGLLTAPKSGKQTRADIKNAAATAVAETEKRLKEIHNELADIIEKVKGRGASLTGKARSEFNESVEKAQNARQKVRELLSALHENGVEDKDLKKAIDGASEAIKHLKTYLAKHG